MTTRRALFVNPPLFVGHDFIDYPYFAQYGLLSSAALTANAGWAVEVADAFSLPGSGRHDVAEGRWLLGVPHSVMLRSLPDRAFDAVVIGNTPFLRAHRPDESTRAFIAALAERYPGASLVLADCHFGGMHVVGYEIEDVLAQHPGLDAVVRYAGDRTFSDPDRLLALKGTRSGVDEPALPWPRKAAPPFPLLEAIDTGRLATFIASCFGDGRWSNPFAVDTTTVPFMTSGGCVHRCIFCASNPGWQLTGKKPYRAVPLEVLEQWAYLAAKGLGAKKLFIMDEIANLRPDFEDMLDMLARLGLRYEFPNGVRADYLTNSAIAKMKGRVTRLSVSVESGNAGALQGPIQKRLDPAEVERVAACAAEVGVPVLVHYIIGFPWETRADVLETLAFAWRLYEKYGAEPAVQYATPLEGTPLFDQCRELGLVTEGADSTDGSLFQHRPFFVPPAIPEGWLEIAKGALDEKVHASREHKVIMNITYSCVNNCEFCATGDRVRKYIPWERVERIIREHHEKGVRNLDIDGGEPTLHPNLLDATRLARDLGYRQVNVTTNGRKLGDEATARRFLDAGITSVLVSLHGHTAAIHDAVTRAPGSFVDTVAGIGKVVKLAGPDTDVGVNITIARKNVGSLMEFADLVWELGARKVNFQMLTPFGNAQADIVPAEQDAADAIMRVIDKYADRMKIYVVNGQPCLFPGYEKYVLADLQKLGRTMVFVWDEEVNLFSYLSERRSRVPACEGCPYSLSCEGFYDFSLPRPALEQGRVRGARA